MHKYLAEKTVCVMPPFSKEACQPFTMTFNKKADCDDISFGWFACDLLDAIHLSSGFLCVAYNPDNTGLVHHFPDLDQAQDERERLRSSADWENVIVLNICSFPCKLIPEEPAF